MNVDTQSSSATVLPEGQRPEVIALARLAVDPVDRSQVPPAANAALEAVIRDHEWLIGIGAQNVRVPWDRKLHAGRIGLFRAIKRYDPRLGSFPAVVIHRIRGAIRDDAREPWSVITIPVGLQKSRWRRLRGLTYPDYDVHAVELALNCQSEADIEFGLGLLPSREENPAEESERVDTDRHLRAIVAAAVAKLPLDWQEIVTRRFGLGDTPEQGVRQIATDTGKSVSQVYQICKQAIKQLRADLEWYNGTD